ncbi:MAG: hypothetical protein ABDH61_03225 [Acidilobaceae archaeon]
MAQVPLDREIKNLVKTGKYYLGGSRMAQGPDEKGGQNGHNCLKGPKDLREAIERRASIANVPVVVFQGGSVDLGLAAGSSPLSLP